MAFPLSNTIASQYRNCLEADTVFLCLKALLIFLLNQFTRNFLTLWKVPLCLRFLILFYGVSQTRCYIFVLYSQHVKRQDKIKVVSATTQLRLVHCNCSNEFPHQYDHTWARTETHPPIWFKIPLTSSGDGMEKQFGKGIMYICYV